MAKTSTLLIIFFALIVTTAKAQTNTGTFTGLVKTETESGKVSYISSAAIELCNLTDTLRTATSSGGYFAFRNLAPGEYTIRITHISYYPTVSRIVVEPKKILELDFLMVDAVIDINSVLIKGHGNILTIKEDTIIYNPAGVLTFEGDEATRLVEQLPGIIINTNSITLLGEEVKRIYVDDKLIFGNDPMAALRNLMASDIVRIRAYDEYSPWSMRKKRRRGDPKERVMNIETRSKLVSAATGHLLVGYGSDFDKDLRDKSRRWTGGATGNFFSEDLIFSVNAFSNNLGKKTNRIDDIVGTSSPRESYNRYNYAAANFERTWRKENGKHIYLDANYIYDDSYTRSENKSETEYFPTEQFDYLNEKSDYLSTATIRTHRNNIHYLYRNNNKRAVNYDLTHRLDFSDMNNKSLGSLLRQSSEAPLSSLPSREADKTNYFDIDENFLWSVDFDNSQLRFLVGFNFTKDDGDIYRSESRTGLSRVLEGTSDKISRNYSFTAEYDIELSDEFTHDIEISYGLEYENSHKKQYYFDLGDPTNTLIDQNNTFDFTMDYIKNSMGLNYVREIESWSSQFSIGGKYQTSHLGNNEIYGSYTDIDRNFNAFLPSISFFRRNSMLSNITLSYKTHIQLPSVEQLRNGFNDINSANIFIGNPRLDKMYNHHVTFIYNKLLGKKNHSLGVTANLFVVKDPIVLKSQIYNGGDYLEGYGTVGENLTRVTTFVNAPRSWETSLKAMLVMQLKKIKSRLTIDHSFTASELPFYDLDGLYKTRTYSPYLGLTLTGTVSRKFRYSAGLNGRHTSAVPESGRNDKYFNTGASASFNWEKIVSNLYVKAYYSGNFYRRYTGNTYNNTDHRLNATVGWKFHKGMGDISFTAFDLIDNKNRFSTKVYSDRIVNNWSTYYGRYFTFNLAYKFNRTKSGARNHSVTEGNVTSKYYR